MHIFFSYRLVRLRWLVCKSCLSVYRRWLRALPKVVLFLQESFLMNLKLCRCWLQPMLWQE